MRRTFKGTDAAFKGAKMALKKTLTPLNTMKTQKHEDPA